LALIVAFCSKKQPFLTKSAIYFWSRMVTQNVNLHIYTFKIDPFSTKKHIKNPCNYSCQSYFCKCILIVISSKGHFWPNQQIFMS
jgi:hypothetical protein